MQVGRHSNVIEAAHVATASDGWGGLFRGTSALLGREVPFYVLGMVGYQQLKKVANGEHMLCAVFAPLLPPPLTAPRRPAPPAQKSSVRNIGSLPADPVVIGNCPVDARG